MYDNFSKEDSIIVEKQQYFPGDILLLNPNASFVTIRNVSGMFYDDSKVFDLDFSGVKFLSLEDIDIANMNIKMPTSANDIWLRKMKKIPTTLDFSNVLRLYLSEVDISNIDVIWPQKAERIVIEKTELPETADLSHTKHLSLSKMDLTFNDIIWPEKAKSIKFCEVTGLNGDINLKKIKDLSMQYMNVEYANITWPSNAINIKMQSVSGLDDVMNFRQAQKLYFAHNTGTYIVKYTKKADMNRITRDFLLEKEIEYARRKTIMKKYKNNTK